MSPAYVFLVTAPLLELSQLDRLEQGQARLERKLDILIRALGEDAEADPTEHSALDGTPSGQDRDQGQSLG